MTSKKNPSIACSVSNCTFNEEKYCSLDKIKVGQHQADPAQTIEATDCESFEAR